jgi:hypothetical protein
MNFVWFMGKINYNMDSYHLVGGVLVRMKERDLI